MDLDRDGSAGPRGRVRSCRRLLAGFYATSTRPNGYSVVRYQFPDDEIFLLAFVSDEDYWQYFVPQPLPTWTRAFIADDEAGFLKAFTGSPDEDYWVKPGSPVFPGYAWTKAFTDDDIPRLLFFTPDEDFPPSILFPPWPGAYAIRPALF